MKHIIAINGSPRSGWNTDILVREAAAGAQSEGAEVETVDLYRLDRFTGCVSCFGCKTVEHLGECIYKDGLADVLEKIRHADGLILGSPVYLGNAIKLARNIQYSNAAGEKLSRGDIQGRNAVSGNDGAGIAAVWSEGQEFSFQEGRQVKKPPPQGLAAKIDCIREIDAAFICGAAPCGIHIPGGGLSKVEDDKGGKYLLKDQFGSLRMEMGHAHGIL